MSVQDNVYITPVSAALLPTTIGDFFSITGVPSGVETTIGTRTLLGDETIGDIIMGGTDYARFNIYLNTVLVFVLRSGPLRQCNLALQRPWELVTGDIVDLKVVHYNVGVPSDFEATILVAS